MLNIQYVGVSAYVDAAYNPAVVPDEASLGVFLRNELNSHSIFTQAISTNVHSVLQAEVLGLLLATTVVKALNWNAISFFSGCWTLVEAAEAKNFLKQPGHWSIRPTLADFFQPHL